MTVPDLERCNCPLTGQDDGVEVDAIEWHGARLPFVICPTTGLQYMNPRPTAAWYRHHYAQEFWPEHATFTGYTRKPDRKAKPLDEGVQRRLIRQLWRARRIARTVEAHTTLTADDVVVDIGAAFGITASLIARQTGARTLIVEPSELAASFAKDTLGVERLTPFAEDLHKPTAVDGQVSLFILSHVLENLLDPLTMLRSLRSKLRPGGRIYIECKNYYYAKAINPYHPYVFNPDSLTQLLAAAGFAVSSAHHEPHPSQTVCAIDLFLRVVATPGPAPITPPAIDPQQMQRDQARGMDMIKQARKQRKRDGDAGAYGEAPLPTAEEVEAFIASAHVAAESSS